MCGIFGKLGGTPDGFASARERLSHRGPDASGIESIGACHLGHVRLSIIDLSPEGSQPMTSPSGRWTIVYNGEVYNFEEMRAELGGTVWRGHSDTEVLLAGFDAWGVEATVERAIGMFAFAAWDRKTSRLYLVRDRVGIKPLYWGYDNAGNVLFASELKAIRAMLDETPELDRDVLNLYFRYNCVPAPACIYEGFRHVEPGTMIVIDEKRPDRPRVDRYWSATDAAKRGKLYPFEGDDAAAIDALEDLLLDAVERRMVADVPLGAFLSGGVDSSTIVALMQARSDKPVKTFTIGFDVAGYNEAEHAKAVAEHLGTDHTELYLSPGDALDVVPKLATMYDEPFSDSSQIPTFLVSKLAREHVTVSLSGDGGDELFAGYNRHHWGPRVWNASRFVPGIVRRRASSAMLKVGASRWDAVFEAVDGVLPGGVNMRLPTEKLQKLAGVLPAESARDLYVRLTTHWAQEREHLVIGAHGDGINRHHWDRLPKGLNFAEEMMLLDALTYLPDDILTKVDRASMAVSLEARVPILDHRVVEFAWSLPHHLKYRDGQSKWALRQVLYNHVPKELIERPKMGFGVPIDAWLRGPLRDWAEDLLDEKKLREDGYLRPEPIRQKWQEHLKGKRSWQHHLWDVLMFQAWREAWR